MTKKKKVHKSKKILSKERGLKETTKKPREVLFKIKPLKETKKVKRKKPSKPAKPLVKKTKPVKKVKLKKPKLVKPIEPTIYKPRIKVIGIGGGGSSVVSEIASEIKKANFVVVDADQRTLREIGKRVRRFQLGRKLTQGLGTGMNPELGEQIAQEDLEKIKELLRGVDFCILISCLGGGIGSGASPVFAEISRRLRNITLGIFTLPFDFEGKKRMEIAKFSLEKLAPNLSAACIISNEKIFQTVDKTTSLKEAFSTVNKFLAKSLRGLIETIYSSGLINISFADLKTILAGRGKLAFLNTIEADASIQIEELAKQALSNSLYPYSPRESTGILFNIAGGLNLNTGQVEQIGKTISENVDPKAKIAFAITKGKENNVKITLLANGCKWAEWEKEKPEKKVKKKPEKKPSKLPEVPPSQLETPQTLVKEEPKEVKIKVRQSALEVRKALEEEEKKMLAQERKWETPTFLRHQSGQIEEDSKT